MTLLRPGQELVRDFQSKRPSMSSHSLVLWWPEPGTVQRGLHAVIWKTKALRSSQPPFNTLQVTGGDWTLGTCSFQPGRMQRERSFIKTGLVNVWSTSLETDPAWGSLSAGHNPPLFQSFWASGTTGLFQSLRICEEKCLACCLGRARLRWCLVSG